MTRPYSLIGYQLTRPFAYLQVKHEDKKLYDWVIPTMLSAASLAFLYYFSDLERVVGSDGLLSSSLAGFIGNLPGFFIAALAAIATFNRKDIDQLVSGVPPQVKVLQGNHLIEIPLTGDASLPAVCISYRRKYHPYAICPLWFSSQPSIYRRCSSHCDLVLHCYLSVFALANDRCHLIWFVLSGRSTTSRQRTRRFTKG